MRDCRAWRCVTALTPFALAGPTEEVLTSRSESTFGDILQTCAEKEVFESTNAKARFLCREAKSYALLSMFEGAMSVV